MTEQLIPQEELTPVQFLQKAKTVAVALQKFIRDGGLAIKIAGREYVQVEGWEALLGILKVDAVITKLDRIKGTDGFLCYRAFGELRDRAGQVVGSGEAVCSNEEKNWKERDEYAICSMSQTRVVGKAARLKYGWVMKLAGYEATPAEEVTGEIKADEFEKFEQAVMDLSSQISQEEFNKFLGELKVKTLHDVNTRSKREGFYKALQAYMKKINPAR